MNSLDSLFALDTLGFSFSGYVAVFRISHASKIGPSRSYVSSNIPIRLIHMSTPKIFKALRSAQCDSRSEKHHGLLKRGLIL